MRHGKKFNHLGRKTAHRKAMLMNLANSLVEHKRLETTLAKAKALQRFVEPILNRAKTDSTHSRRMAFRYLKNKVAINTLFGDVASKIGSREGGYTRVLKTGFRAGDNAELAIIELVDFNDNLLKTEGTTKKKRSRRSKSTTATPAKEVKSEEAKADVAETIEVVEEVKEEKKAPAKKKPAAKKEEKSEEAPKTEDKSDKKTEE